MHYWDNLLNSILKSSIYLKIFIYVQIYINIFSNLNLIQNQLILLERNYTIEKSTF